LLKDRFEQRPQPEPKKHRQDHDDDVELRGISALLSRIRVDSAG
jgi:hypothetical protein